MFCSLRWSRSISSLLIVAVASSMALCAAAADVPPLTHRMTDLAHLMDASHRQALEARLISFEEETSHQISVLTVPSLDGEPIEAYSIRVTDAWRLGLRGIDDGILLLIAEAEHKTRIEVGRGLEGVVTDAASSAIIREVMAPHFERGEFAVGIDAGVTALMAAARLEVTAQKPRTSYTAKAVTGRWGPVPFLTLFGAVMVFIVVSNKIMAWLYPEFITPPARRKSSTGGQASGPSRIADSSEQVNDAGPSGADAWGGGGGGFWGSGGLGGGGGFGGGGASGGW